MADSYHHGQLRQALVEAAVDAARVSGMDGLTIRELARTVGVSHNAAYRHFADRDELVAVVAQYAMGRLTQAMNRRWSLIDDTDPQLRARRRLAEVGRAYIEFATTESGWFRVAFAHRDSADVELMDGGGPYGMLGAALDEMVAAGVVAAEGRLNADIVCWSAVHGFANLVIDGPLRDGGTEERDQAITAIIDAVDRSLVVTSGCTAVPLSAQLSSTSALGS